MMIQAYEAILHKSAYELGIKFPAVCLIRNVSVQPGEVQCLNERIDVLMDKVKNNPDTFLEQQHVRGFRELFTKMGYPTLKPAGERVFGSFQQKGFKRYDNIVDAYNIICLETVAGIGMHDASRFLAKDNKFEIRTAEGGGKEKIVPLNKDKSQNVKKGDLIYGCCDAQNKDSSIDVMAWLGKNDVDSNLHKVTDKTNDLVLVVLGNEYTTEEFNKKTCTDIFELILLTCPNATMDWLSVRS